MFKKLILLPFTAVILFLTGCETTNKSALDTARVLFKAAAPVRVKSPLTSNVLLMVAALDTAKVLFKAAAPVKVKSPVNQS